MSNIMNILALGPLMISLMFWSSSTSVSASSDSAFQRTVIFIYAPTSPGQNIFIRGGLTAGAGVTGCGSPAGSDPCSIPIRHSISPSVPGSAYGHWSAGDTVLDWYGNEAGQGNYSGQVAGGTPLMWTSYSNPAGPTVEQDGRGYTALNRFGDHYWMLDVDMDCDKTYNGFFEFKAYTTPLAGWERDIVQYNYCAGLPDIRKPYLTNNHMALCGQMNVFYISSNECSVYPIPTDLSQPAAGCGNVQMFPDLSTSSLLKQSVGEAIVNGQASSLGRWPWQGVLQYGSSLGGCACVLIDSKWAVTAAHCVRGTNPSILQVNLGQQNLVADQGNEQVIRVSNIHIHENYGISDGTGVYEGDYDIALLHLASSVDFSSYIVNTACLPRGYDTDSFVGDLCFATGFGSTQGTGDSNRLNEIEVPVLSLVDCMNIWGINNISIRQVCMGDGVKSACGGDSGGPLVCWKNSRWVLVGITSWGSSSCQEKPSVYTRMTEFITWIDSVTGGINNPNL